MPNLAELQESMRRSIHAQEMAPELDKAIVSDELTASTRLQIYQNNYQGTLVDTLLGVFPIVSAFVGEVFTRTALKHFIEHTPPTDACLSMFGEDFPRFIANYKHAEDVAYLEDIAELEWQIHALQHVQETSQEAKAVPTVNKNAHFIKSEYPLLNLWLVGTGQLMPEAVHLDQGGQHVCVLLDEGQVQLFALSDEEQTLLKNIDDDSVPFNDGAVLSLKTKKILV